jgi:hypothetical protein
MTKSSALSRQSASWKNTFLGALSAAGLKFEAAVELLRNRDALKDWVSFVPECLERSRARLTIPDRRRLQIADAAAFVARWQVKTYMTLEELDLTDRTLRACERAGLFMVTDLLSAQEMPTTPSPSPERDAVLCKELRDRLMAGGFSSRDLPEWMRE